MSRLLGERATRCYAWRTLLDEGVRMAFGSDAPVEDFNPFHGIHAAVTRRRADGTPGKDGWFPELRISVQEAIEGFSTGAAYAAGLEDKLGKLAVGYLADLIVIENDPFRCDPQELYNIHPIATMVGGEWAWRSE
jgi:predicted amidohydrolase YtcJ